MSTRFYLLIIAHPDDESMFFTPTLASLLRKEKQKDDVKVGILCLSNGNYDGLGKRREREMIAAARILGFNDGHDDRELVRVLDDERLQDGPKEEWDAAVISECIDRYLQNVDILPPKDNKQQDNDDKVRHRRSDNNQKKPTAEKKTIVLLTFDQLGVSQHINHVHTHRGVQHFLSYFNNDSVEMFGYELVSITNPLRKYNPFFLWIQMLLSFFFSIFFHTVHTKQSNSSNSNNIVEECFLPSNNTTKNNKKYKEVKLFDPIKVWYAMAAHESQFVWYRRLSVLFSQYTYENEWRRI